MATNTLPLFPGCSNDQLKQILETIATTSTILVELAIEAASNASASDQPQIHALQYIAERIGALADTPLRGEIRGSFCAWTVALDYDEMGKRAE